MRDGEIMIKCSFCGKDRSQVRRLIAGPMVYICNECVELAADIIDDMDQRERIQAMKEIPKYEARSGSEIVQALKVDKVLAATPSGPPYGRRYVGFQEKGYRPAVVTDEFISRTGLKRGMYFVLTNGKTQCLPAEEFEKKYKAVK